MTPAWYHRPAHLAVLSVVVTAGTVAALVMGPAFSDTEDASVTSARITKLPATKPDVPTDIPTRKARDAQGAAPETKAKSRTPEFDRRQHSTTDPASIWVVVNKRHALAPDYVPRLTTVRGREVAEAVAADLTRLLDDADGHGLGISIVSAYRSYARQQTLYSRAVATKGSAHADTVSARPGHSEHQTGLAVDLTTSHAPNCTLFPCFGDTTAGQWLARDAWRYGFIIRYNGTNRETTGFATEPWHLRYVGVELAREMHRRDAASLEEFLGVAGGDYLDDD